MILKQSNIKLALEGRGDFAADPLTIIPTPHIEDGNGSASIDLRLGRWFLTLRKSQHACFDPRNEQLPEAQIAERQFVRFDKKFILHPKTFVLGATLEWIRIPTNLTGTIVGKSSWGRRGLIIETAPVVHPGFSGCLTLELTNVGEIPISLSPGDLVCQLQLMRTEGDGLGSGPFDGLRRPALGEIRTDKMAKKLSE